MRTVRLVLSETRQGRYPGGLRLSSITSLSAIASALFFVISAKGSVIYSSYDGTTAAGGQIIHGTMAAPFMPSGPYILTDAKVFVEYDSMPPETGATNVAILSSSGGQPDKVLARIDEVPVPGLNAPVLVEVNFASQELTLQAGNTYWLALGELPMSSPLSWYGAQNILPTDPAYIANFKPQFEIDGDPVAPEPASSVCVVMGLAGVVTLCRLRLAVRYRGLRHFEPKDSFRG